MAPLLLDIRAGGEAVPDLELSLLSFAAWCYHAASVLDWVEQLTSRRLATAQKAADGELSALQRSPVPLDLAVAPSLAWQTVTAFRSAVGLDPKPYPLGEIGAGAPLGDVAGRDDAAESSAAAPNAQA